jgi:signal transduction histidine kinase
MSDDPSGLTEEQTIMAFRIIQESLTNVTRHANASQVKVVVLQIPGELYIEIQDNGIGFQLEKAAEKKSFGLIGMRERVSTLDGKIDITSTPQQGTLVSVNLPIPPVLQNAGPNMKHNA